MKKANSLILAAVCLAVCVAVFGGVLHLRASAPEAPAETPGPSVVPTETPEPTPTPTPEPQPEYFVLSFVGDCTIGSDTRLRGSASSFEGVVGDDYAYPFAATLAYFADDYLSVANMEGTFTTAARSNGATFTFKADPAYAAVFPEGSIELVTLGNNHAGDYLDQGREDTKAALDAAGVLWADEDGICIYERDGGPKVGVYSKLYPTVADVQRGVAALREAGAEIIVAALHWGVEKMYQPTADQQAVGHAAIDAGAQIVYGCHPHVLQKTEEYGGGYILYSLGNWSFGGHTNPSDKDTAIARVTVMRDVDGTLSLDGLELIPCRLSGSDTRNDYQPRAVDPDAEPEVFSRIQSKLDGSFDAPYIPPDYSAYHQNESTGTEPSGGESGGETSTGGESGGEAPSGGENGAASE